MMLMSIGQALRNPRAQDLVLLCFGFPLALFSILSFKGHVEANWAFMGYVSIAILTMEISAANCCSPKSLWIQICPRFLTWGLGLSLIPVVIILLHGSIGILPASLERKWAKDDRIIWETRDWDKLGKHIGTLTQPGDVIAADSYQLTALLEYNVPNNPSVRYLAPWKRPTQFDIWEPSFDNLAGKTILFVSPIELKPSSDVLTTIYENFSNVIPLTPFEFLYHGVEIRRMFIYRCENFNPFQPKRLAPRSLHYSQVTGNTSVL